MSNVYARYTMNTAYVIMSEYSGYLNTFMCGGQCFAFSDGGAANAFIDAVKVSGCLRDGEELYTCAINVYGAVAEPLEFKSYMWLSDSALNDMGIIILLDVYASAMSCQDNEERDRFCKRVLAEIKRKAAYHVG